MKKLILTFFFLFIFGQNGYAGKQDMISALKGIPGVADASYSQAFEKRVTGYADDGVEAWFTFSYSPSDIFSLSFAGSGEAAGVWITKGEQLDPNNTLCLLLTNDPNKKLQTLIMSNFMTNYGLGGTVKVDPQNTRSIVKGEITNTVLYYFLRAAQDSKNTNDYLENIDCN